MPDAPQTTADHTIDPHTQACSCGSDHDHGPTGADIVRGLGRGFAILTFAVPAFTVLLVAVALLFTPTSPLPILLGVGLGLGQIAVVIGMSALSRKIRDSLASTPVFLAARVVVEEALRLVVALIGLLIFHYENYGSLGLWIGVGAMLVWTILTTSHVAVARTRILKPGDWSKGTVLSMLEEKISVKRAMTLRFLDIAAVLLFQVAATTLVAVAPIMIVATFVLSLASGLSTLVLQRMPAPRRQRSAWAYAPISISLLLSAFAHVFVLVPTMLVPTM